MLGISPSSASGLYANGIRSKGLRARSKDAPELKFNLSNLLSAKLLPYASKRGITVRALVSKILQTVARENLIDAVLDDDGGAEL